MSSSCFECLGAFIMDVAAVNASLTGVKLYKVKDDKFIFIDSSGSKFAIHVANITKITMTKAP